MSVKMSDLDADLRDMVDDADDEAPLYPLARRYRAFNKAIQAAAVIIDEADEGHRVKSFDYTSTADREEYPFPARLKKMKQVVNLDSDGLERHPPRTYIPWFTRTKYRTDTVLALSSADVASGSFYTYRGDNLVLVPIPKASASSKDVRLHYLDEPPVVLDGGAEFPLPYFARGLVVALAARELVGPTGDETGEIAQAVAHEKGNVAVSVTPRTDDGPIRITDVMGDASLAAGY